MTALANFAMLSHGWQRVLLMIVAGALAALSAAPLFILPALFIALPVLVWTLDGAEKRTGWRRFFGPAFGAGFFFGLGYFCVSVHWVGAAFFVDGGILIGLMPLAVLALAAVLALFWAFGISLAHLFWTGGASRIVTLATGLALAEFARGHLFTGFPFNLLGYALTANEQMMQAASLLGVYGLTFVAALIAATPALVWPATERTLVARLVPLFLAIGVIALQVGYGQYRIAQTETTPIEGINLRVVQPVVSQDLKWQAFAREEIVTRMMDLSAMRTTPEDSGLDDVTHLIWPEAALPFFLSEQPEYLARIARMLPEDTVLLTGAPREPYATGGAVPADAVPFNSILAINSAGEVVSSYDKTHLVPIGEYLPFKNLFAALGITQFVPGSDGWAPGDARRLISLPGSPAIMPLICYEAVYSAGLGAVADDADFILVVTNDAWFDGTIGPAQHFHHARLRTVEEGMSMVRAANSGISAIIDPLGRVTARIAEREVGTLKGAPDARLAPTFFAQWGHIPFLVLLGLGGSIALIAKFRARRAGHFF
jgi:apolipoprotein N-acyltransferase